MAGERTLPGDIGLTAGWDLGDNTYKTGVDENFRKLSMLVMPHVDSIEATAPGSPSDGDIHISSGTWGSGSANDIIIRDDGSWVPYTPASGWEVYNRDTSKVMRFTGTEWVYPSDPRPVTDATTSYDLADEDLDGRTIIYMSNGGTITFTLTASLTKLGPVTVINTGGGSIEFTEDTGVTLNSVETALKTQWGAVTIIPQGSDVFVAFGNLEAP